MSTIYLDYNSGTPIDPIVLDLFFKELQNDIGNPSSIHLYGQQSRRKLDQSRQKIASFCNVKPQEIIFTSGGTEGASLLLRGMIPREGKVHLISSRAEHSCVYETLQELERQGVEVTYLPVGEKGAVNPLDVEKAILPHTRYIVLTAVNNETGVMTDLEEIGKIVDKANIYFIVDGVAWLGKEQMSIPKEVSAVFFSGHKIHAPKGIGFCVCRQKVKLLPLFLGGNQEYKRRAGTENIPGIIALAESIRLLEENQTAMIAHMRRLRDTFEERLFTVVGRVLVNGSGVRVSNTSNLSFLGVDGETLLLNLDRRKVFASHGSACASGAMEPSRVLLEMGIPLGRVRSSVRFSFGRTTTMDEVERAVDSIVDEVNRLRSFEIV